MIVKYYRLVSDTDGNLLPRSDFLENGLFRATQPKFLNDKGSEGKFFPYFNEFSPADIEYAKKRDSKFRTGQKRELSEEELIDFYLKPIGSRYDEKFPYWKSVFPDYETIYEYDRAVFEKNVENLNNFFTEHLSCFIGVLSLSKSDKNELMWTHYASDGKGIAVSFNENHSYFERYKPVDVSYKIVDRASVTYFEGQFRLDGYPVQEFEIKDNNYEFLNVLKFFNKSEIDLIKTTKKLLYSKSEKWVSEEESRIVFPLYECDEFCGSESSPLVSIGIPKEFNLIKRIYSEFCLKKIPFSAFESIIFGYDTDPEHIKIIIDKAKLNPDLKHLTFKKAKHDVFGSVITEFI